MDIEKYYWKAKDENEARVICELLKIKGSSSKWTTNDVVFGEDVTSHCYGIYADVFVATDLEKGRTLSTIPALVEMALRGFKDAWEVAPEGYRLVTEEERVNNNKPSCAKIINIRNGISWWEVDLFSPWIDTCNYAVPTSYEFETSNQKQIRELADSIRRDTTKLEELKKGE